jgi:hypothetical protein
LEGTVDGAVKMLFRYLTGGIEKSREKVSFRIVGIPVRELN